VSGWGERVWVRRARPLLALILGVLGYLGWRHFTQERLDEIFEFLPADHGLFLYLDLDTIESSLLLGGSETLGQLLDDKGRLARHLAALSRSGVEDVALSVGVNEIRAVARGAFDGNVLKAYVERQGLTCAGPPRRFTCTAESPQTRTEVVLIEGSRIELIDRSSSYRSPAEHKPATYLAVPALTGIRGGAFLWMALQPGPLEEAMNDPPRGMINLTLFARALREAAIAYVVLEPDLSSRSLDLRLSAFAPTPERAAEMLRVVEDTNALVAGAIKMGSGDSADGPWSRLLQTGTFRRQDAAIEASWRIAPSEVPGLFADKP